MEVSLPLPIEIVATNISPGGKMGAGALGSGRGWVGKRKKNARSRRQEAWSWWSNGIVVGGDGVYMPWFTGPSCVSYGPAIMMA